MVRAEVSERTNESVLVAGLGGRASSSSGRSGSSRALVGDVVDAVSVLVLVRLTIGVHHGGLVSFAGETIFLKVALLLTVSANGVGVPQGGAGAGLVAGETFLLEAERSKLAKLFVW